MTGLDLESFLLLLRADLGVWALIGLGTLVLGLLVRLSWGSRRALRKCLILSVVAHAGLALYGSTMPLVFRSMTAGSRDRTSAQHIRKIQVAAVPEHRDPRSATTPPSQAMISESTPPTGADPTGRVATPDIAAERVRLVDSRLSPPRPREPRDDDALNGPAVLTSFPDRLELNTATPTAPQPLKAPEANRTDAAIGSPLAAPPLLATSPSTAELAQIAPESKPRRNGETGVAREQPQLVPALPPADLRNDPRARPSRVDPAAPAVNLGPAQPIPLARATPAPDRAVSSLPLADLTGPAGSRSLLEVPRFYRSRLDANRLSSAARSGASAASEQAVERALDWLARHQDSDGRWDGGIARYEDGSAMQGDDDFTVHCPQGQTCFGECAYWEADTALTGLALLTFLGAGYTQQDGKYAVTVSKGLDFLLAEQKPDGDLRGPSKAVGMYCHAMATLAVCEAYALSLDDRLREPVERAVAFLARARARDGEAWRYLPGAPVGDTSILGWVVMALKSAHEIGLHVPGEAELRRGAIRWLERVATGQNKGLARYQPSEPVTPTMTAEAWVCRQFLGAGGLGESSSEAANYLIKHESDRGDSNFYYWYYGTLALYQHGGQPWTRWNDRLRDRIVGLQKTSGHQSGSWEPDESMYGARGGRIYCTTLAALTLEVYYRYLRLYDKPSLPADFRPAEESAPALEASKPRG